MGNDFSTYQKRKKGKENPNLNSIMISMGFVKKYLVLIMVLIRDKFYCFDGF